MDRLGQILLLVAGDTNFIRFQHLLSAFSEEVEFIIKDPETNDVKHIPSKIVKTLFLMVKQFLALMTVVMKDHTDKFNSLLTSLVDIGCLDDSLEEEIFALVFTVSG